MLGLGIISRRTSRFNLQAQDKHIHMGLLCQSVAHFQSSLFLLLTTSPLSHGSGLDLLPVFGFPSHFCAGAKSLARVTTSSLLSLSRPFDGLCATALRWNSFLLFVNVDLSLHFLLFCSLRNYWHGLLFFTCTAVQLRVEQSPDSKAVQWIRQYNRTDVL